MSIDVLIPSKNPNKNLLKTIKSINHIKEIKKIIIIDDSQNLNDAIYEEIKNSYKKIFIINNCYSQGISGALNSGIKFSSSRFISRIDSGDVCLDKGRFRKILKVFEQRFDVDLICSGLINNLNKKIEPQSFYLDKILSPFSKVPHPTWIFRRSSIKKKYREKCTRFEDYAFLIDNNMKILIFNQFDVLYDTSDNLSRITEFKTAYLKSIFFINQSKKSLKSLFFGLSYFFLRTARLILSTKKILF